MQSRVLLADDDHRLTGLLRAYLERAGHSVAVVHDGHDAIEAYRRLRPDLVILDVMMPTLDGRDVCQLLRAESRVPIVFLTAKASEDDLIAGLQLGADDYLTKPFSPRELVARLEAVLRRSRPHADQLEIVNHGPLSLDESRHELTVAGRQIACTPAEFRIVRTLMAAPGRVFSRSRLLEAAFGYDHSALERTIDVHIRNLRRKIEENPSAPTLILTVHGVGYKLA